jgi:hypothetical protein
MVEAVENASSVSYTGIREKLISNFFLGGVFMSELNVTDLAVAKLKEYMQANNIVSALRVALMQGG